MKTKKFPALYHGTDARIVMMTDDERQQYLDHCKNVIDYLFPFYDKLATTFEMVQDEFQGQVRFFNRCLLDIRYKDKLEQIPGLFSNLHKSITLIQARNRGNRQYQYGSFYVTSMRGIAVSYALRSFAGGELGYAAYNYIRGLECVKLESYNPSRDIIRSMGIVGEFAGDEGQHDPVIFTFKDIDIDCLQNERGNPLPPDFDDFDMGQSFRLLKDVQLSLDGAEHLKK